MLTDAIAGQFNVGDVVNVPCVVTAVSGTSQPSLTLTTKYKGFAGTTDTITGVDSNQVITAK